MAWLATAKLALITQMMLILSNTNRGRDPSPCTNCGKLHLEVLRCIGIPVVTTARSRTIRRNLEEESFSSNA